MALATLSSLDVWFASLLRGARIFLSIPGYQSHCSPNCTFTGTVTLCCWFLCLTADFFLCLMGHSEESRSGCCQQFLCTKDLKDNSVFSSCLLPFCFQDTETPWHEVPWANLGLENVQAQFRPAQLSAASLLKHLVTQHLLLSNNLKRKEKTKRTTEHLKSFSWVLKGFSEESWN